MRKFIVGFIVGAMAFTVVQASADGVKNLVGQKVGNQWELFVDGEVVGSVPIIEDKSYAPVRVIAEIAGMNVDFESGKVYLTSREDLNLEEDEQISIPVLETNITFLENRIFMLQVLRDEEFKKVESLEEPAKSEKLEYVSSLDEQIAEKKQELADKQARLKELKSQIEEESAE